MSSAQTQAQGLRAETPAPGGISRADLLAIGRAGRAWEFVPIGLAALAVTPGDDEIRLMLASSYARLGLVTPARAMLATLSPEAARHPNVALIGGLLASLPADRITPETRIAAARANLDAIGPHGRIAADLLRARFDAWSRQTAAADSFRTRDGNIVFRPADAPPDAPWTRFADELSRFKTDLAALTQARSVSQVKPIYLGGLNAPWILKHLADALPRNTDGSWSRIIVCEPSLDDALTGLSIADLRGTLSQERTLLFLGPGAGQALADWLDANADLQLVGPTVCGTSATALRSRDADGLEAILEAGLTRQRSTLESAVADAARSYADCPPAHWARRFADALAGRTKPLRVLIPTTRYSTFLRHSSEDLAAAFKRAGCDARLLIEPDDASQLSGVAYARRFAGWKPDLLLLVNYPRSSLGASIPTNVPCVMYVQDAMPHLFRVEVGRTLGPLDFVMGHLHSQFFTDFGYPRARTLQCPVVASADKFHQGPVAGDLRARHACEVAYVSHQSETPEACRDRLIAESRRSPGGGGAMPAVIEAIYPHVARLAHDALRTWHWPAIRDLAAQTITAVTGRPPDPDAAALVVNSVIRVLGDRLIRHQAARWAAEISARRGWRFHLYGRGWEKHPMLAHFARGELAHGEELRASYQCAAIHLHASSGWLLHQRVMECAMSGGLPVALLKREDVDALTGFTEAAVGARIAEQPDLDPGKAADRLAPITDHWEAVALAAQCQRIGLPAPSGIFVERDVATKPWLAWGDRGMPYEAAWLLGDWSQTTFSAADGLESLIAAAVERPSWRADLSSGIAARTRRRFTHDAVVAQLLPLIRRSLAAD